MDMSVEKLPDEVTRIVLAGSLDIKGAAAVEVPFTTVAGKSSRVVVDCTAVDFVASIGLRLLVGTARTISRRGGKLVLCGVTPPVAKILTVAGMDGLLPSFASSDAALAAVKAGAPG
ncbi:MAG: STAS domain-containing protein [Alphaproteobacteria bacterium]|nr:STAS domain-containing protein [Alphaproteobacteria bacterium]